MVDKQQSLLHVAERRGAGRDGEFWWGIDLCSRGYYLVDEGRGTAGLFRGISGCALHSDRAAECSVG